MPHAGAAATTSKGGPSMTNKTPDTPGLSETELRAAKVDDLRERAAEAGIGGRSSMRKQELVEAISQAYREGSEDRAGGRGDAGPEGGRLRTGAETSKS